MRTMWMTTMAALLAVAALAQTTDPATTPAPNAAPLLVCEEPSFDFGTQDNSQAVEHTYVLRNAGNLTLEISQVRPSCGCTVASITERSVPPGGESRVTARLSLQGRTGPQHKTMTVESNDPQHPQFVLTLQGVAAVPMDVQPPRIATTQLTVGAQPQDTVTLTGHGAPFKVTSVEATTDRLRATIEPVEEGRVYKVTIMAREPLGVGQLDATVIIRTDHPQRPTIEVPVTYVVNNEVVVAPPDLVFPTPSEEPVTRTVYVSSGNNTPFQLEGVDTPDAGMSVQVEPFGPTGYKLQVANIIAAPSLNGQVIKIRTTSPNMREIALPLRVLQPPPAP